MQENNNYLYVTKDFAEDNDKIKNYELKSARK